MSQKRPLLRNAAQLFRALCRTNRLRLREGEELWDEWADYGARKPVATNRPRRAVAASSLVTVVALAAALSAGAGVTVALVEDGHEDPAALVGLTPDGQEEPAAETSSSPAPESSPAATPTGEPPTGEPAAGGEQPVAQPEPEAAPEATTPEPEGIALGATKPAPATPPAGSATPETAAPTPEQPSTEEATEAPAPTRASKPKRVARKPRPARKLRPNPAKLTRRLDPEVGTPGSQATVWLHRTLPDPTPPSKRLTRTFARQLAAESRAARVPWALVLGVLRTRGQTGAVPASGDELGALARKLGSLGARRDQWGALRALGGSEDFADQATALTNYHRAVGMEALVRGLEWAKPKLAARLLRDDRVATYWGGRADIEAGRIDVRVLTLIAYLAETYGDITVSCLETGHGLYSRPGVISAHIYGLAVDISGLDGKSIMGNSEPGGLTEDAVRNILLLPSELQPRQVISLLGLGGPSFPMGNHDDHIHVGY